MNKDTEWDDKACEIAARIDRWETMKIDADRILEQLKMHSPLWARLLRKYIRSLEREACGL